MSDLSCPRDSNNCHSHFHDEESEYLAKDNPTHLKENLAVDRSMTPVASAFDNGAREAQEAQNAPNLSDEGKEPMFRKIIRHFTPSYAEASRGNMSRGLLTAFTHHRWFIITMSTGALSIAIHQVPYHARWLNIISTVLFVLNLALFLLFTFLSSLRYLMHPELFPAVLRHGHQSLFLATFPVGLATSINMIVLVCTPVWGQGMAILAWALWWLDSVLAAVTCFHLTWVM
jgi:hypothetical protein